MRLLLDTHVFLHIINGDAHWDFFPSLSNNELFLSIVSVWEITIKINIGKLKNFSSIDEIFEMISTRDISLLPINPKHLSVYLNLPLIHRYPFDRLIIAQAMFEGLQLFRDDKIIQTYPDLQFFK